MIRIQNFQITKSVESISRHK